MASSFAALVSLETLIHTIQDHPNPPISLDSHQVQSLLEILAFLQEFLQLYSHLDQYPTQDLESFIKQAAYAAEDVIESCIVDRIENSTSQIPLFDLDSVINLMDAMKKQAMEINKIPAGDDDQQPGSSVSVPSLVSPSPSSGQNSAMVGSDELFKDILHRLTQDQSSRRQIIPIVGMGGIGKTTLAAKAYEHGLVKHYFDSRVWITISQNFFIREILLEIVRQQCPSSKDDLKDESVEQIGLRIHQSFSGKRYLVVMDDLWSIEAWNMIRPFVPDNYNGSRIVITTRLSDVASVAAPNYISIQMKLLDEGKSWDLFRKMVFGEDHCPVELEKSAKTIARNCKGLPLSIAVVGGILSKSQQTERHWQYVARNLSSIVNLEDNERCLKILQLSYRQLPIHLKPCFLYMGLSREDERICVSYLVKLLVAEGFLKPIHGELIESVAEKYIQELVDRNLLLIDKRGSTGSIRYCRIHDLVRDLCLRQAKEENFRNDRIVPRRKLFEEITPPCTYCKLFRIFNSHQGDKTVFYNLRFLSWVKNYSIPRGIIPCISLIWNLQTIIIGDHRYVDIWEMCQHRHIKVPNIEFSRPINNLVLSNLQTLYRVSQFECTKDVVEKLPNIQKLAIRISFEGNRCFSDYCLNNLEYLHKLKHLQCYFKRGFEDKYHLRGNITFPHSLKKLTLESMELHWEDVTAMVGSLSNLEKLKLIYTQGSAWRPTEGQFLRLKFLELCDCNLKHWAAYSSHFPLLERLILIGLINLVEIPPDIGEIPTLHLIKVDRCSASAAVSAKTIAEEQDALGNSELHIQVIPFPGDREQLASMANQNFEVICYDSKFSSQLKSLTNSRQRMHSVRMNYDSSAEDTEAIQVKAKRQKQFG